MLRVASRYVRSRTVAEEVVQETWLGVLNGLDRFEGRASLKTWIFRILTNRAISRARARGAHRAVLVARRGDGDGEPAVDPDRFRPEGDPYPGGWKTLPGELGRAAGGAAARARDARAVDAAIAELPDRQHLVIVLRDIEGWRPTRSASRSRSARPTSGYCCTVPARRSAACLESYLDPAAVLT